MIMHCQFPFRRGAAKAIVLGGEILCNNADGYFADNIQSLRRLTLVAIKKSGKNRSTV